MSGLIRLRDASAVVQGGPTFKKAGMRRQCVKLLNLSAFLRRWALKLPNFAPALRAGGSHSSYSARRLWRLPSALRRLAPIALHLVAASDL